MESLFTFTSPPSQCSYLPDREWQLHYEIVGRLDPREYMARLKQGWRRFGYSLFRPACPVCTMCRSLRVPVATFRPDRSQRRAWAANATSVVLSIGAPSVSPAKLALYDKFHQFQHERKNWPGRGAESAAEYAESFTDNPFATEEWCYHLDGRLIGVGYVDRLPEGLSAIYFYHDPDEQHRSLGTFNVLSVIGRAAKLALPHVYLGYFVEGCRSLEYKARFRPNEVIDARGEWAPFQVG